MIRVTKCGKTWKDQISHFLDEIMIASTTVATESANAIGQISARKEDLREALITNGDLYMDIGSLKEKIRGLEKTQNDLLSKASQCQGHPPPGPRIRTPEYMVVDQDTIQVVEAFSSPKSGTSTKFDSDRAKPMSEVVTKIKGSNSKDPFPPLGPATARKLKKVANRGINPPGNMPRATPNPSNIRKARTATVGSLFSR